MKKRFRILLHSMIFKRDLGTIYILANLLENLGCECFIANNTNYMSIISKLWNPHAVLYVTLSRTKGLRQYFPHAKLFLYSAEAGDGKKLSRELPIIEDEFLFNTISRVYLWGNSVKEILLERRENLGSSNFLWKMEDSVRDKFIVAGNPHLDKIKYAQPLNDIHKHKKIKIGFIGKFNYINKKRSDRLLRIILNYNPNDPNFELGTNQMLFQIKLLSCYCYIIEKLGCKDYSFSIRPYVAEELDSYSKSRTVMNGKLEIDNSIDFSTWVSQQDILIGSISTTIAQIAMAKKTFIALDLLNDSKLRDYQRNIIPTMKENCPENYEELFYIIENFKEFRLPSPSLKIILDSYYNFNKKDSVLLTVAQDIVKNIEKENVTRNMRIPENIFNLISYFNVRYNEIVKAKHHKKSYSYFNSGMLKIQSSKEFDSIVKNIIKQNYGNPN